jgi:hypothetical protein
MGSGSQVERRFHPEAPNARLAEIATRHGIALHDLLGAFRRETAGGTAVFFRRDGHWNERGHALAASEVARFLAARELLSRSGALAR